MKTLSWMLLPCAMVLACGARTALPGLDDEGAGAAGAGGGGDGGDGAAGTGGSAPLCDPPVALELVASGLDAARYVEVFDGWAFVLGVNTLFRVPVCGGPVSVLAENPRGAGSLEGLSVGSYGVRWGASGSGAFIGRTSLDGEGTKFDPLPGLLAVAADASATFTLSQSGEIIAQESSKSHLLHSVGPIGYWGPLVESDGWLYFSYGASNPNGPLNRIRTDTTAVEILLGGQVPGDLAVRDGQVFIAIAHGIDQIQTFDATLLDLVILASAQPSPTRLAVGLEDVYFVTTDGVRLVPRGGGEVIQLATERDVRDVAVDDDAFYFVTSDGRLLRAPL